MVIGPFSGLGAGCENLDAPRVGRIVPILLRNAADLLNAVDLHDAQEALCRNCSIRGPD